MRPVHIIVMPAALTPAPDGVYELDNRLQRPRPSTATAALEILDRRHRPDPVVILGRGPTDSCKE